MANKETVQVDFKSEWWVKHNMNTFSGRLMHWFYVANPRNGLTSDSTLKQMQADVQAAQNLAVNGVAQLPKA